MKASSAREPQDRPAKFCYGKGGDDWWVACEASCPSVAILVGGRCSPGNTRGAGVAVESFGQRGSTWVCRYVEARTIGQGKNSGIPTNVAITATPVCLAK